MSIATSLHLCTFQYHAISGAHLTPAEHTACAQPQTTRTPRDQKWAGQSPLKTKPLGRVHWGENFARGEHLAWSSRSTSPPQPLGLRTPLLRRGCQTRDEATMRLSRESWSENVSVGADFLQNFLFGPFQAKLALPDQAFFNYRHHGIAPALS